MAKKLTYATHCPTCKAPCEMDLSGKLTPHNDTRVVSAQVGLRAKPGLGLGSRPEPHPCKAVRNRLEPGVMLGVVARGLALRQEELLVLKHELEQAREAVQQHSVEIAELARVMRRLMARLN